MFIVAVSVPIVVGEKVTVIVQGLELAGGVGGANELPQVLVWEKLPGLLPPNVMLPMAKAALPELVRVSGEDVLWFNDTELGKVKLEAIPASGAKPVPVTVKV